MLHNMNYEQKKKFWNFVYMDDIDFFYEFIADLSDDEQIRFFEETPDFLSDNLNNNETTDLEEDAIYQRIMKKISQL
ncbi:hypothetical protein MCI89_17955 [Muricomes sp. OA1]|nr:MULTISPECIES: hypothetical protein [Clostridia]MCH1974233.1 hypothetical protein [Muricomes sp. OA1]GKH33007.1 hypothetical protein CE91St64_24140 [Faecalicatena contorta]